MIPLCSHLDVVAGVVAFTVCLVVTPLFRGVGRRRGWLDHPDSERKTHPEPVPRIGGIGIFLAFALGVALPRILCPGAPNEGTDYLHLVAASCAVMLIGLVDDVRGASPMTKLLVQFAAAAYLYVHGWQISLVTNPFGGAFSVGIFSFPLTMLWLVGITNAFNLIDGLDGLAAGVAFFALTSLTGNALLNQHWAGAQAAIALAGALLGFLFYNFSPASVFLGDSGAFLIGFTVSALAISNSMKATAALAIVAPLLALALPILDVFLAVVRRSLAGRHIFTPDREHIHHKLLERGLTPRRAVLVLYCVSAAFSALSLLAVTGPVRLIAAAGLGGLLVILLAWGLFGGVELDLKRILGLAPGGRKRLP